MQMTSIHKILLLFLFLYAGNIYAQKNTVDSKAFNLLGLSDYFISAKTEGNTYVFTMYSIADGPTDANNITFTLRPLTKESFIQNFFLHYAKFEDKITKSPQVLKIPSAKNINYDMTKADSTKTPDYKKLEEEATKLFYMFVARSIVIEDLGNEPIAGTICYVDSLLILRRDVNDQSLNSRIQRLWKVYKKDGKPVKELLKLGELDSYLDLGKEISDTTLNNLVKKLGKDSISGEFGFSDLTAGLNKRKFIKEKSTEFLQRRAHILQGVYEKKLNDLNDDQAILSDILDSLANYSDASEKIDSIKSIEIKRKDINQKFKVEVEKNWEMLVNAPNYIYNRYYKTLKFEKGPTKEEKELILNKVKVFYKINCQEQGGEEWHKEINAHIEDSTKNFKEALKKEEEALKDAKNSLDSNDIKYNIKIFTDILNVYDKLSEIEIPMLCEYVNAINDVNTEQDEMLDQIKLLNYKSQTRSTLTNRTDPLKFKNTKISIPNNSTTTSDAIIEQSNTLIGEIGPIIKKLKENTDLLKNIKDQRQEIVKVEDQLIFKRFKVDSIVLEINEGFIENILMVGKVEEYVDKYGHLTVGKDGKAIPASRTLKFENSSPIGFSRKLDFDAIKGKKLYTRGGDRTQYETYIEDVLSIYIQEHEVGRRDYSPANQKVVLKKGTKGQTDFCLGLEKEATYRLFEAKIFSDFVGLDETEPNGLIQTEVSKRINLLTSRKPFQFFSLAGLRNEWNVGIFSFLEPALTLSKIENNNKYLTLDNKDRFINNTYAPIKFTSTLKLKQFENFSAGATANLLLLDMPNIKSTFFLNWGFRYGRTGIQDSIRTVSNGTLQVNTNGANDFGVNTFDHSPEIMWNIYADERYGFSMSWQHHWFYLRDNRFEQVANTTFYDDQVTNPTKDSRQFNTFRFLMTLEQSNNNKGRLFFRYTYNWQQGFWRTGFHQAQVGYSFFLLGRPQENAAK